MLHASSCMYKGLMYYIYVFYITQTLALNALSTTGTQLCTVQLGFSGLKVKTKQKQILQSLNVPFEFCYT